MIEKKPRDDSILYLETTDVSFQRKVFHCALSMALAELWIFFVPKYTLLGECQGGRRESELFWDLCVCMNLFASLNCSFRIWKCLVPFFPLVPFIRSTNIYEYVLCHRHKQKRKKSLFSWRWHLVVISFLLISCLKVYRFIQSHTSNLIWQFWILWNLDSKILSDRRVNLPLADRLYCEILKYLLDNLLLIHLENKHYDSLTFIELRKVLF